MRRLISLNKKTNENQNMSAVSNNVNNSVERIQREFVVLPYVKLLSERLSRILAPFNVQIVYSVPIKLKNGVLKLGKDEIELDKRTHVIYKIECADCQALYIGQTKRYMKTRINEHKNNFKKAQIEFTVISEHRNDFQHEFNWNGVTILASETRLDKRRFAEMAYIKKYEQKAINKQTDTANWKDSYNPLIRFL